MRVLAWVGILLALLSLGACLEPTDYSGKNHPFVIVATIASVGPDSVMIRPDSIAVINAGGDAVDFFYESS